MATGFLGGIYLAAALVLGGGFVALAVRLLRRPRAAPRCASTSSSLAYLALLFCAPRTRVSAGRGLTGLIEPPPWTATAPQRNIGAGLLTAAIAVGVFGLSFFVAIVYIG